MARFYGAVGYVETVETVPGVHRELITERYYYGDVLRNSSSWMSSPDSTNDNLRMNNQFSILADPFAYQNFHLIKYVEYMGTKWEVTKIDENRPRLILTVGGVYANGQ